MTIDRRAFTRNIAATLALGLTGRASLADSHDSKERAEDRDEGGLRHGSLFTSSNSAAGNSLLAFGSGPKQALTLFASYPTGGLGSGAGLGSQGAVTLSSDGRQLYVVNAGSNSVSVFSVRAGGLRLESVQDSGGLHPISVAECDDIVYVLNDGGSGNIAGFRSERGRLWPIGGSIQPLSAAGGTGPAQVAISPDGDVLVVTEKNTSRLVSYALSREGRAGAPRITPSAGATPFGFVFDRRNQLLVSEAAASTLSSYRFEHGTPTLPRVVSAAVPTGQAAACWAMVTPNGRFVYTGNAGSSSISQFAVARNGAVELRAAAAASTQGGGAGDLAIAAHGRTLSILAPRTPAIFSFAVGADGSLSPAGSVGGLPAGVVGLAAN